ncbi:MAG TPA: rRNA maturation RNase YbeY [Candidatus Atribacteria bacterium]|nr:rRNA maturation RNase YbeY [Candidatus Atribacteria bacterium]
MEILIKNQQKIIKINQKKIREIIRKILQQLKVDEQVEVSILFTTDKFIRYLNKKYRDIDEPTDVLSFSLQEEIMKYPEVQGNRLLGDVIISTETAQRQADTLNHSVEKEVILLLIHGLLHLIGYDHIEEEDSKIMHQKEMELLSNFDF